MTGSDSLVKSLTLPTGVRGARGPLEVEEVVVHLEAAGLLQ